jgi:hypothetical protein
LILQAIFVSQPTNEARLGVFIGEKHGQDSGPVAVTIITPSSAEDALTILAQHHEAASPDRSE